jgi:hypothetical protein
LRIWQAVYSEAQSAGMSPLRAQFASALCVAHFASASAVGISRSGVQPVMAFIAQVAQEFKLATLLMGLYPRYAGRMVLGLFGFYGRYPSRHPAAHADPT